MSAPPHASGRRREAVVAVGLAAVMAMATLGGSAQAGPPATPDRDRPAAAPLAVPADDLDRGLVYTGLAADRSGPCAGLFRVIGVEPAMCTHGPDPAPAGLSVKRPVAPLPAGRAGAGSQPLAVCEGDGVSGRRVEVLYVRGSTSRYNQYLETFRQLAEAVDVIFNESARATGGERHVRYVTESVGGACRPVVRDVQIPDAALNANDWAPLLNAVKAAGYTRTDRKYLQFVDARVFCGLGGFAGDTRKSDANRSNSGPEYARMDNGCWSAGVAAHELGHTLGAVNNNAPNASGYAHCVDEWDVMCYKDNANTVIQTRCADRALDQRLDCNHDDYYHTNPPAGSYLAQYFNVADNLFLIRGTGGGPGPNPDPPAGNLARSATATASYTSPWENVAAVNDGVEPTSSNDAANPRWGTWPEQGEQWVELTWPQAQSVSAAEVYFFDDNGGVRTPAGWRVQYWNGSGYLDVPGASGYPTAVNQYNRVTFTGVNTSRLRVVLQGSAASVGLLEVRVAAG
ncbi:hypothetical protein [Plantactinospora sp. BC1]|uniref:DUF7402 domain-containing protein n=1 Tax=Plantactinospora sp. BC1 TaxID=2108470 RepID=UPI00131F3CCE|nr:hypothetical protein [Plantactinospora sp. BC1]